MSRPGSNARTPAWVFRLLRWAQAAHSAFARTPAHAARRSTRHLSSRIASIVLGLFAVLCCAVSPAQDNYRQQMKGLDEQVQEIKSDVLNIAQELNRLEEKLLYPSNTHLALFVAFASGEAIRLDSVQIQIDGQPVARYVYSHKEVEALQKGGVQRIYTGNVPTGAHQLEVSVMGKLAGGRDYNETSRFSISKGIEPKLVGITLASPDSGRPAIDIGDW